MSQQSVITIQYVYTIATLCRVNVTCVLLAGEDLSRYSNTVEPVGLRTVRAIIYYLTNIEISQ